MSFFKKLPALEIAAVCAFLFPSGMALQMPPQPARLIVKSAPDTGASIKINGQQMARRTDAVFVVSPGQYSVAVSDNAKNVNCPEKSVNVSSGELLTMTCSGTTWTSQ